MAPTPTPASWLLKSCPMEVAHKMTVPVLIVNSKDDPISSYRNVKEVGIPIATMHGNAALVVCDRGSHTCHFDSVLGPSWSDRPCFMPIAKPARASR